MGVSTENNFDDVLSDLEAEVSGAHTLTVANVMEYANYLNDRQGYYVFNAKGLRKKVLEQMTAAQAAGKTLTDDVVVNALDAAGYEYINWLLDKVGGTQPPIRTGEGARAATRGGWATITGNLAASFRHKVDGLEVRDSGADVEPSEERQELAFN